MTDYTSIIERLERATGADRELDIAVARCFEVPANVHRDWTPRYSESIDAAVALVGKLLPDALWKTGHYGDEKPGLFLACVMPFGPGIFEGASSSPAIAILLSLFRSLSAKEPRSE
jgi:hypothetical protein